MWGRAKDIAEQLKGHGAALRTDDVDLAAAPSLLPAVGDGVRNGDLCGRERGSVGHGQDRERARRAQRRPGRYQPHQKSQDMPARWRAVLLFASRVIRIGAHIASDNLTNTS